MVFILDWIFFAAVKMVASSGECQKVKRSGKLSKTGPRNLDNTETTSSLESERRLRNKSRDCNWRIFRRSRRQEFIQYTVLMDVNRTQVCKSSSGEWGRRKFQAGLGSGWQAVATGFDVTVVEFQPLGTKWSSFANGWTKRVSFNLRVQKLGNCAMSAQSRKFFYMKTNLRIWAPPLNEPMIRPVSGRRCECFHFLGGGTKHTQCSGLF